MITLQCSDFLLHNYVKPYISTKCQLDKLIISSFWFPVFESKPGYRCFGITDETLVTKLLLMYSGIEVIKNDITM
jgi:hypothetical protein